MNECTQVELLSRDTHKAFDFYRAISSLRTSTYFAFNEVHVSYLLSVGWPIELLGTKNYRRVLDILPINVYGVYDTITSST